jgi:small conductance mechanosensitive channel
MLWHRLFTDPLSWRPLLMGLIPALVLAWLAARVARRVLYRTLATLLQESLTPSSPFIRAPLRLMSAAVFVLVFSVLIVPALEIAGMHPRGGVHLRSLSEWAFDSGLRVLLVIAFAYALIRGVGLGVKRFETDVNFGTGLDALERARRARTLGAVLSNVTSIVVVAIATLMVLHELRVDISPALTGTAVVGVALGFGAQTLVKDLIGGFFLILENQVRVGDVASINGTGGLVEAINLRTIVLRDEQGTVHVIPNGSIETLANLTKATT